MSNKDLDGLLTLLCSAPESQLSDCIVKRIKSIIGKPKDEVKKGLVSILDDCANYSLASDFTMTTLNIALSINQGDSK